MRKNMYCAKISTFTVLNIVVTCGHEEGDPEAAGEDAVPQGLEVVAVKG